jgi:hypothetical protein
MHRRRGAAMNLPEPVRRVEPQAILWGDDGMSTRSLDALLSAMLVSVSLTLAVGVPVAGAATPEAQLLAPIRLATDSMNKGDTKTFASTLSSDGVTIIDEIAPHLWAGADAFDRWFKAYGAWVEAAAITDSVYKMGKPTSVVINGDRGYVAVPFFYTFKQKGVATQETAHMVFVLQKEKGAWLITAFTWGAGTPKPATSSAK